MITNTLNYINKYKQYKRALRNKFNYSVLKKQLSQVVDDKLTLQFDHHYHEKRKPICSKINIFDQSELNNSSIDIANRFKTAECRKDLKFFGSRALTQIQHIHLNKTQSNKYHATISAKQKVIYLRPKSSKSTHIKPNLTERVDELSITTKKIDCRPTSAVSIPKSVKKQQKQELQQRKENIRKYRTVVFGNLDKSKGKRRESLLSPW